MPVERSPVTEEAEVPTISVIPDKNIDLEKVNYHGVYVLLYLRRIMVSIGRKSRQIWRQVWMRRRWRT